ncbi:MAG: MEDS domain-containing protein [Streptosporangiaceae bacterium]
MSTTPARSHGVRFEFVRMRPGDHLGWAFAGASEYAALATSCLMEGAALGERLMYVAEHPDASAVAALYGVADQDALQVVTIADVYGTSGIVDPQAQLAHFGAELDAALAAGYSGLRVVSDSTRLVTSDASLAAWRHYELLADQFTAVHPVTALCAFDARRLGPGRLAQLAAMHPLSSASGPVPPYRLFFQGSTVRLDGPVTVASMASLGQALAELPADTPAAVDLGAAGQDAGDGVSREAVAMLNELADAGTPVLVHGQAAALRAAFPAPGANLMLRQY